MPKRPRNRGTASTAASSVCVAHSLHLLWYCIEAYVRFDLLRSFCGKIETAMLVVV